MRNSASADGEHCRGRRHEHAVQECGGEFGRADLVEAAQRIAAEHEERDAEAAEDGQADSGDCHSAAGPLSGMRCGRVVMWVPRAAWKRCLRRALLSAASSASTSTSITRAICRAAFEAAAVEPGRVDRHGERLHAEIFRCADVVDGLHQHQRDAGDDRRPRHRQQHAPEHLAMARRRACAPRRRCCGPASERRCGWSR